jgi:hypothetical protein
MKRQEERERERKEIECKKGKYLLIAFKGVGGAAANRSSILPNTVRPQARELCNLCALWPSLNYSWSEAENNPLYLLPAAAYTL